ncbi:MAG: UbiA family prenyltransferase [Planctomycetota bacterium]
MPTKPPMVRALIKLARPTQWGKGVFVLIGPAYALAQETAELSASYIIAALGVFTAFGLASSGCYIVNDIADRAHDANHPRKKHRPIASGVVPVGVARVYALALFAAAGTLMIVLPLEDRWLWTTAIVVGYTLNVLVYSALFKHRVILDVVSLSLGFVLRVLAGCAAVGAMPSTWLLNSTLFLAMFLAFGKRLGERRTMEAAGAAVETARGVQKAYSDDLLRMAVVMTAVGTLVTYAGYVESQEGVYGPSIAAVASGAAPWAFNWLWLTMIPATYALLRCIVLLERGLYDDPTELAVRDRGVQLASIGFGAIAAVVVLLERGALPAADGM